MPTPSTNRQTPNSNCESLNANRQTPTASPRAPVSKWRTPTRAAEPEAPNEERKPPNDRLGTPTLRKVQVVRAAETSEMGTRETGRWGTGKWGTGNWGIGERGTTNAKGAHASPMPKKPVGSPHLPPIAKNGHSRRETTAAYVLAARETRDTIGCDCAILVSGRQDHDPTGYAAHHETRRDETTWNGATTRPLRKGKRDETGHARRHTRKKQRSDARETEKTEGGQGTRRKKKGKKRDAETQNQEPRTQNAKTQNAKTTPPSAKVTQDATLRNVPTTNDERKWETGECQAQTGTREGCRTCGEGKRVRRRSPSRATRAREYDDGVRTRCTRNARAQSACGV